MKKFSLFLSLFLAFTGATKAQNSENSQEPKEPNVVLVTDAAEELIDGTVIALQSRDYSAGAGYYFAGADYKTATFSANNLFVVEGNAKEGMKLRHFNGTKYIGKESNSSAVTEVESAGSATTFTAQSYNGNFTLDKNLNQEMDGTERALYVRFFADYTPTFLNMRDINTQPIYHGGTGGYSVWYVYRYPEYTLEIEQVEQASLSFNRTSATTSDIIVNISGSGEGEGGNGVDVEFETGSYSNDGILLNQNLRTNDKFSSELPNVLCPDANIGNGQKASLTFTLTGLPKGFRFNRVSLDIHSIFNEGSYQSAARWCDVTLSCGEGESKKQWGAIENQNITNAGGRKWTLTGEPVEVDESRTLVLTIDIKKGASSINAFYVGLGGITLIDEERSKDAEVSEETITEMKISDVKDLLKVIEDGYNSLGYEFPVQAKVEGTDENEVVVVWPQALNGVFSGLDDNNFKLLTHAKNAIEDAKNGTEYEEKLNAAKQNLADFIRICKLDNNNYPVSVVYEAAADYGTLYTPFAVTLPDGLTLQKCTGCADNVLILSEEENNSSAAVANTAYIVKANDESAVGTTVQLIGFYSQSNTQANSSSPLKGTHTGTTLTAGGENNYYVLQNLDVLGFYEVGEKDPITVPAHKCYLQLPAGLGVKCLLFPDGTLTAIDSVDAAKPADAATYDLSGRRVGTMTKGLYIVDGKKVIVK